MSEKEISVDLTKWDFKDEVKYVVETGKGISEDVIRKISEVKNEPEWMLEFRLKSFRIFQKMPVPKWGANLEALNLNNITFYRSPSEKAKRSWDEVPEEIKDTFEKLGIPEAERKILAGVGAQYESEVVYHSLKKELEDMGVVFLGTDQGLQEYPEIFKKYFGRIVPPADNKYAALNSAVWSGGSFVYVPEGVKVDFPLQAYFRINESDAGQFERTLIIAEKGADVHYIEGCTAPTYTTDSLHSAVVEIIAKENSHIRYTTIQNWSTNVYNLVTKRAHAYAGAFVEWVDGNLGSKVTMKYPGVYLLGPRARGEVLSIAYAAKNQHQDTGAKMIHMAPNTSSKITSKSISVDGGRASYRGLIHIAKNADNVKTNVMCDALLLDERSRSDTYPYMEINNQTATVTHEATVGKISEDVLFYAMSRGIPENEALHMIVMGFIEDFTKELPLEYAVELNRLIALEMTNAVG